MIPDNPNIYQITESNSHLLFPWPVPDMWSAHESELKDYEYGGIAIQDPSKGLQYQIWTGYWNLADSTAYLQPEDTSLAPIPIFTESDVIEFCFTFDQNMRWVAATRKADNTVQFRWYNSQVEAYVTSHYSGIFSVRLCHDDKRASQVINNTTDVILTYSRTGAIYWRIQRDRFTVEYSKPVAISNRFRISHFGMSYGNRLQWRIGPRHLNT